MKIDIMHSFYAVRHIGIISILTGNEDNYQSIKVWEKLVRYELKANRIAVAMCNEEGQTEQWQEKQLAELDKIEKAVKKLLPNVKTFFINTDPRGYALKLKDEEARKLNLWQDMGGYGILTPDLSTWR